MPRLSSQNTKAPFSNIHRGRISEAANTALARMAASGQANIVTTRASMAGGAGAVNAGIGGTGSSSSNDTSDFNGLGDDTDLILANGGFQWSLGDFNTNFLFNNTVGLATVTRL